MNVFMPVFVLPILMILFSLTLLIYYKISDKIKNNGK